MSRRTSLLLRHRAAITTLFNLTLATVAWVLAFALRFDLSVPENVSLFRSGTIRTEYSSGTTCFGNLPGVVSKE